MVLLIDLLADIFGGRILAAVLGLFGYDLDWEPTDGRPMRGWRRAISYLVCFMITAALIVGLIWLIAVVEG